MKKKYQKTLLIIGAIDVIQLSFILLSALYLYSSIITSIIIEHLTTIGFGGYLIFEIASKMVDGHFFIWKGYHFFSGKKRGEHIIQPDIKFYYEVVAIVNAMDERDEVMGLFYQNIGKHHAENVNKFLYDNEGNEHIEFIGEIKEPDNELHESNLPLIADEHITKIEYESLNPVYYCTCIKIKDKEIVNEKKKKLFYWMKKRRLRCKPCLYEQCKINWRKENDQQSMSSNTRHKTKPIYRN